MPNDPYDPCPTPLQPAACGTYVVQGQRNASGGIVRGWGGSGSYALTGQPQVPEPQSDYSYSSGARACVGKSVGFYTVGSYDDSYTVNVFDKVVWQPVQNPRAIDVYLDGKWYQRVRW